MVRRSGRRPGPSDTREAILAAARKSFAERGFDASTIRAIASDAEVDPALVHHYFGTKDALFLAAMNAPFDPAHVVVAAVSGDPSVVGERLVRTFLGVWDGPAGAAGVALLRSAVSSDRMTKLFREFVTTQILRRAVADLHLDPHEEGLRVGLVATQLAGLAMIRYVVKIEPIADAPADDLAPIIGATVQRYLTGDLPSRAAHR